MIGARPGHNTQPKNVHKVQLCTCSSSDMVKVFLHVSHRLNSVCCCCRQMRCTRSAASWARQRQPHGQKGWCWQLPWASASPSARLRPLQQWCAASLSHLQQFVNTVPSISAHFTRSPACQRARICPPISVFLHRHLAARFAAIGSQPRRQKLVV